MLCRECTVTLPHKLHDVVGSAEGVNFLKKQLSTTDFEGTLTTLNTFIQQQEQHINTLTTNMKRDMAKLQTVLQKHVAKVHSQMAERCEIYKKQLCEVF